MTKYFYIFLLVMGVALCAPQTSQAGVSFGISTGNSGYHDDYYYNDHHHSRYTTRQVYYSREPVYHQRYYERPVYYAPRRVYYDPYCY